MLGEAFILRVPENCNSILSYNTATKNLFMRKLCLLCCWNMKILVRELCGRGRRKCINVR